MGTKLSVALCASWLAACGYPSLPRLGGDGGTASDAVPDPDAPRDAPGDARVCFGTTFPICLAAPPMMPLNVAASAKLDTSQAATCVATISGGDGLCVVAATTITISAELRGVGDKPLVLIASDSIIVTGPDGEIDVGNHRGDADVGAGANPTTCVAGTAPQGGGGATGDGGGAGGSFTGAGGTGGAGGDAGGAAGMPAAGTTNITTIRGGCLGQQGAGNGGAGGRGGGAVHLIAGNAITIGGRGINAGGEGGGGAASPESGGGGGGSGGMIGLDAPTITGTALLVANGGGGGEGADETSDGNPGADAAEAEPAVGGGGAVVIGGNGGLGSSGAAAGAGGNANAGGTTGGNDGGGGGGGGGAGLIKAPALANLGTMVSPAPTP